MMAKNRTLMTQTVGRRLAQINKKISENQRTYGQRYGTDRPTGLRSIPEPGGG